jgi:hypothetical protein
MVERQNPKKRRWPTELGPDDKLMAYYEGRTGRVAALVISSAEKQGQFIRDNRSWWKLRPDFVDDYDDPGIYLEFVDLDFIDYFDQESEATGIVNLRDFFSDENAEFDAEQEREAVTAAVGDCPPATQDIILNLANRQKAIDDVGYGPLNPEEPNEEFWTEKAERWSVTIDEAKTSICGNCAAFVVTTDALQCIADGISMGGSEDDAWDTVEAGQLGYCDALDFKCAASRTCNAWITGGPITDDSKKEQEAR